MLVPHFLKYLWTYEWVIDWLVCRVSKIFHALWGSEGNCQGKWPTDLLAFRTDRVLPLPLAALLQCEHPEFDRNGTFSGLFQGAAQCCVWSSLRFNHAQHVFPWSDMISEYIGSEVPNVNRFPIYIISRPRLGVASISLWNPYEKVCFFFDYLATQGFLGSYCKWIGALTTWFIRGFLCEPINQINWITDGLNIAIFWTFKFMGNSILLTFNHTFDFSGSRICDYNNYNIL